MSALIAAVVAAAMLQGSITVRTLDRGDQSSVDAPRQATVRTAAEWDELWRRHSPDRPQPRVDFAKEMVVAVFLGSRNTAGYAVEIVSAQNDGGAVVVRYRQREPARDAITAQIITMPYDIAAIPKSAGDVRFERVQ